MSHINNYKVAELILSLTFAEGQKNDTSLVPSLEPFRYANREYSEEELFFHLHIDDTLRPVPKAERTRIKAIDTGNGETIVDKRSNGGYQFIIKDTRGNSCCLLITDSNFKHCQAALNGTYGMRTFGLNNALMLIFAFAGSSNNLVLIHASLVRNDGWGYAFTAKSGTGKSTQVSMWLRYIPGCDLMNDDNPIIRIIDGEPFIYGSPWSGKTPCYRNVKARLGAITQIVRDTENHVDRINPIEAFTTLITSVSAMKWDSEIFNNICKILSRIIETTPIYNLYCRADKEAALVCQQAISRSKKYN